MVDSGACDSQRVTPLRTDMAFMIIDEAAALRSRKSKLLAADMTSTDASIISQAPNNAGMQCARKRCRSEQAAASAMAPLRTVSILTKRRRSVESAQVFVAAALHQQADGILEHRQQLQQHMCRKVNILENATTSAQPQTQSQKQVTERQEENAYVIEANDDDDDEKICTTPRHFSKEEEELPYVCPPAAPNKPKAKPRRHNMAPPYKKFFVPSNIHHLPLCFQSLFS